jgi:hypothetical protein
MNMLAAQLVLAPSNFKEEPKLQIQLTIVNATSRAEAEEKAIALGKALDGKSGAWQAGQGDIGSEEPSRFVGVRALKEFVGDALDVLVHGKCLSVMTIRSENEIFRILGRGGLPDGKHDGAAPLYDCDAAICFACDATGVPEDVVIAILRSRYRFLAGMGIEEDPSEAKTPDLFPRVNIARRYVANELEWGFVARETGVAQDRVAQVLSADHAFMRSIGIVD